MHTYFTSAQCEAANVKLYFRNSVTSDTDVQKSRTQAFDQSQQTGLLGSGALTRTVSE